MKKFALAMALIMGNLFLQAYPENHTVLQGDVKVVKDNQRQKIEASNNAILQWESFSVNENEYVEVIFKDPSHTLLNKVIEDNPTEIFGKIISNGHIYLINPYGILIGKEGKVNCKEFVAATAETIDEKNTHDKNLLFDGCSSASIVNVGKIETIENTVLIATTIENLGIIKAKGVALIAAQTVLLLINSLDQSITQSNTPTHIENKGQIDAEWIKTVDH